MNTTKEKVISLEKEIIRTAKEIGIKDIYINIILNELKTLWAVNNNVRGLVVLMGEKTKEENGKKKVVQIKAIREYRSEIVKRMEILTKLFKAYKALKDLEELEDILFTEQPEEEALKPVAV